jgi:hypothetical protein
MDFKIFLKNLEKKMFPKKNKDIGEIFHLESMDKHVNYKKQPLFS